MRLLEISLRASEEQIEKSNMTKGVTGAGGMLDQLYADGRSRIAEQRMALEMVPVGALMVQITVEQWCEGERE